MVSRTLSRLWLSTVNVPYGNWDPEWTYSWPMRNDVLWSRNASVFESYRVWVAIETQLRSFLWTKWLIIKTSDRFCKWTSIFSNGFHISGLQQNVKAHIGSKETSRKREVGGTYLSSLNFFYLIGKVMLFSIDQIKRGDEKHLFLLNATYVPSCLSLTHALLVTPKVWLSFQVLQNLF